jgi:DNA-binding MarR family transcriptional regulator
MADIENASSGLPAGVWLATDDAGDRVERGIAMWNAEKPELDTAGKSIVGRVVALNDIITRNFNAVLAPHGLRYTEYAVLATLRARGQPHAMSPSQLQAAMLFTSGGLSNLLRRLAERDLISRSTDRRDRRGVIVALTEAGLKLADETMPVQADMENYLIRMLSSEEWGTARSLLSKLISGKDN